MSVSSGWGCLWRHNPNPREPFFAAELCSNFGLCKTGCKNSTNQLAGLQLVCPYDPLNDLRSHIGIPLARPLRRRGAHCSIYPFNDIGAYTGIPLARPLNRRKAKCYTPFNEIGAYIGIPLARPLNRRGAKCSINPIQ